MHRPSRGATTPGVALLPQGNYEPPPGGRRIPPQRLPGDRLYRIFMALRSLASVALSSMKQEPVSPGGRSLLLL